MATATTDPVRLPPGPRIPKLIQGAAVLTRRYGAIAALGRKYGSTFTLNIPVFGETVVISDPVLVKDLFSTHRDLVGRPQNNLGGDVLGPGSIFNLEGDALQARRKLLLPPFNGKSMRGYASITEEEALREIRTWPEGVEFETLEPMMRITLNTILRAVFGADGAHLDELRRIIPPWVTLGSRLAVLPTPHRTYGRFSPWGRLAAYRRRYDDVIGRLIDAVQADPDFDTRDDILALLLRSTYEDGSSMSRPDIGAELLTRLAAGHETTAATLGWAFERISRHPAVLAKLVAEAETDGNEYRQATILEIQRSRTVIDFAGRHVYAPTFELGEWVIPQGYSIVVAIGQVHKRAQDFVDPDRFDPQRYVGQRPPTFAHIPFGGGTRRCVGAAFANVEMDIVLRTVLRHFVIETTAAPGEKMHSRGVAYTPKDGGRVVMRRR